MTTLAFLTHMTPMSWIILLALGLLLFGRRLPEVGRSLGKGIVEFKKGLAGVEEQVNEAVKGPSTPSQSTLPPTQPTASPRIAPPATPMGADGRVSRADVVD
ncbi:MAG: twin-arginine translocase TatA/TatE family subunit [Phycisphaerales bacterium]